MTTSIYRPRGYRGKGDSQLRPITRRLCQVLSETQRRFAYDTLSLEQPAIAELAGMLVEFAEDLLNDIGIWKAYERYNVEFFGTPLPMTEGGDPSGGRTDVSSDRFRHFLWVLYPAFIDGLVISPTHQDLRRVADASSLFLADAFTAVVKDSGVKAFLQKDNQFGWDVKRKLVWLGTGSYLFRIFFADYVDQNTNGKVTIAHTDDFVCQECTRWSGLCAIDVLAQVLDIPQETRDELRSWYERHAAFYKVIAANRSTLEAVNLINNRPYRIRINMDRHPFRRVQVIFGSLVPWRGQWYWSGEQKLFGNAADLNVDELKQTMKRQSSRIVCRYDKQYEAQVRERAAEMYRATIDYYGKDLVVYPDGISMAADWQKEFQHQWDSRPPEEVQEVVERHGLKDRRPRMNLPKDLLDHEGGIGVFINPNEGKEIMTHFTSLIAGLERMGGDLTEEQERSIRGFFDSPAVSPAFVRRVLSEFGDQSVKKSFVLRGKVPGDWLDYLLRSRKGHYYRKRYPTVAVI